MKKISLHTIGMLVAGGFWLLVIIGCQKDKLSLIWASQNTPSENILQAAFFHDEQNGYVCGGQQYTESTILSTQNGGETWEHKDVEEVGKMVFDILFLNADTGFAVTHGAKILRTYNGGDDWDISSHPLPDEDVKWQPLRAIQFVNDSIGFVVGGIGYNNGVIMRTLDGGDNWNYQYFELEFRDVYFTNAQTGYAAGFGAIYKTTNGGDDWFALDIKGDFFVALHFPSPEIGYAVGNQGMIVKTINEGHEWDVIQKVKLVSINRPHYEDVFFVNEEKGFITGENVLAVTNNGGLDWKKVKGIDFTKFFGVCLVSDSKGFVMGNDGVIVKFEE